MSFSTLLQELHPVHLVILIFLRVLCLLDRLQHLLCAFVSLCLIKKHTI